MSPRRAILVRLADGVELTMGSRQQFARKKFPAPGITRHVPAKIISVSDIPADQSGKMLNSQCAIIVSVGK